MSAVLDQITVEVPILEPISALNYVVPTNHLAWHFLVDMTVPEKTLPTRFGALGKVKKVKENQLFNGA